MVSKNAEVFDTIEPTSGVRALTMQAPTDPFAAIHAACEAQVEGLMVPSREKLSRIRSLLDSFETNLRFRATAQVMGKVYAALGQPPPTSKDTLEDVEDQLFGELDSLTPEWAKPDEVPVAAESEPAPTQPAMTVPAPAARLIEIQIAPVAPPSRPAMPEPSEDDLAKAKALIAEVEGTNYAEGHPLRMTPLMQAHVAEIRCALMRVPERHPVGWQLTQMISRLARAKADANIQPFIKGLARNHRPADWHRVALEARKQVARYDVDVETTTEVSTPAPAKKTKKETAKEDDKPSLFNWPALPSLRERLKNGPLVLAGGVAVPNKLSSVQTRFGIAAEWHEIDDGSARAVSSLVEKVKKGRIGAVICLKGLIGHDTWKDITDACKTAGVPCATGDKGGVGDIQLALEQLDKVA